MAKVRAATEPGLVHDGGGLFLQVTTGEATARDRVRRSWLFRFTAPSGKRREMGLGAVDAVSLARARELADSARALLATGTDPIEHRKTLRTRNQNTPRVITFREAAQGYIGAQAASWRNARHAKLWVNTLVTYAYPTLGGLPVEQVDVTRVLGVLEPIWSTKPETASRVRQRIEAVLDWAAVKGMRSGDNPARWRGHLEKALPARSALKPVRHHPALSSSDLPAFMRDLRATTGDGAHALRLCILTVVRTSEVLAAPWSEFDLDQGIWTIGVERMKARRPHRVPLSRQALELLRVRRAAALRSAAYVFPGQGTGSRPLSGMSMLAVLRRMSRSDITVHGFRSTFRDWVSDATEFSRETAEAALAHSLGDKTEQAYRRGDSFEKRRALMQAWADFADGHLLEAPKGLSEIVP